VSTEKFREFVGVSVGEASMCWSPIPGGLFDATRASTIVDSIVKEHERILGENICHGYDFTVEEFRKFEAEIENLKKENAELRIQNSAGMSGMCDKETEIGALKKKVVEAEKRRLIQIAAAYTEAASILAANQVHRAQMITQLQELSKQHVDAYGAMKS
jgi:hypothetical protein